MDLWDRLPRRGLIIVEEKEKITDEYLVTIVRRNDRAILGQARSPVLDIARAGAAEQALSALNIFHSY